MAKGFKSLSIVIPVYNEESTIAEMIKRVKKAPSFQLKKEIVVVDDGSTDRTAKVLKKTKGIKVVRLKKNQGKGTAIRTGLGQASGDILLIQDADLEYNPDEYRLLLQPILKGFADVVYGSRFVTYHPHRVLYFWHTVGNRFLTSFSNMLTNLNLTDMETGYKVFTREVIRKILPRLTAQRFGIEPEITARVAKLSRLDGVRIYEVGISYFGRTYKEGKKVNWKDGLQAIWQIFRYNLFN